MRTKYKAMKDFWEIVFHVLFYVVKINKTLVLQDFLFVAWLWWLQTNQPTNPQTKKQKHKHRGVRARSLREERGKEKVWCKRVEHRKKT